MSKEIVQGLTGQFKWAAKFYDKFIDSCPEEIWGKPSGRFPVWQTVYHALGCVPFFLTPKEGPQPAALYPQEVLLFKDLSRPPADRKQLAAYAKEVNALAGDFLAGLSDADLAKPHEGLSSRIGIPRTNLEAVSVLVGHHMYHFGMCDAALRADGLEGLF